jgi:signal transduction histidine kinase
LPSGSPLVSSWEAHRAALEAHLPFFNFELWRFVADGTRQCHCVSGEPVFDEEGRFAGYRGTTRDITTQKLAEQTQREQRRLLARAQELGGLGYWEYEASTGLMTGSRELRSMLEIPGGLPGQTPEWSLDLVDARDRERVRSEVRRALEQGATFEIEAHVTTIAGKQRIMVFSGEGVKDSAENVSKVIGSCADITERRHRERALLGATDELQSLSRRLVEAQETERRRLAVELHDQVGQNLTALCINFDILARRMNPLDTDSVRRLQDSINLLEATAQRIEGVLDDLRPPMLDDWGIGPTAQWVAEAFSTRTDIPVHVQMLGVERRFDRQKELALVRVLQEALNNVAKHAHAEIVDVLLRWRVSSVHVEIVDNGIGFEHDRSGARRGPRTALDARADAGGSWPARDRKRAGQGYPGMRVGAGLTHAGPGPDRGRP